MDFTRMLHIVLATLGMTAASMVLRGQNPHPEAAGLRSDAPTYAKHGPYWVGTREFVIKNPKDARSLQATLWYPALNPKGLKEANSFTYDDKEISGKLLTIEGRALVDALPDPSGGPYPLLIFSHGDWGSRLLSIFFQQHVASHGFVVLGLDHPTTDQTRFHDLICALDYAKDLSTVSGAFESLIDDQRTALAGHGLGGLTTFQVAGCRYLDDPSFADPRIKAVISMATGVGFGGEPDQFSYRDVQQPTLLLGGTRDNVSHGYPKLKRIYQALPGARKALVYLTGSGYAIFFDPNVALPGRYGSLDVDRAHDLVNHFITAFLLDVLKGDQEAHKALLPEAVKFEEVEYTTTWK